MKLFIARDNENDTYDLMNEAGDCIYFGTALDIEAYLVKLGAKMINELEWML